MSQEEATKLLALAIRVRNLQTKYFEFRDKYVLNEAKRNEKLLDNHIVEILIKYGNEVKNISEQGNLFK